MVFHSDCRLEDYSASCGVSVLCGRVISLEGETPKKRVLYKKNTKEHFYHFISASRGSDTYTVSFCNWSDIDWTAWLKTITIYAFDFGAFWPVDTCCHVESKKTFWLQWIQPLHLWMKWTATILHLRIYVSTLEKLNEQNRHKNRTKELFVPFRH